ncbi:hypothetical protein BUALT_Bualt07G0057100 [Buddleja alternifolia]|uniref:Retrovirus-related Pol polyprotein from transposon TNT 1-94-like beta-barrel domain-containing protein n=1 Tax=Buddleja alternifolia TaxID=168488 RepID=A0AAV6X8A5_9LAMI|nr:hypothetical protein BUALT_Bualt07G0057100 [Buddleja alternifolia]
MELDESNGDNITFGDSSQVQVKGKGTILIRLKDGSHQFISNVLYMLEMKTNNLSLGQLLEKNYDIHLKNKSLMMKDDNGHWLEKFSMTRNSMFMLNIQSNVPRYRLVLNVLQGDDSAYITMFEDAAKKYIGCLVDEFLTSI